MSNKNNPNATKRQMEVDWSDWEDTRDWSGKAAEPESELSKPVEYNCHKGGEKVTKEELRKEAEKIIEGARNNGFRQATDEELFGHLVVSEEEMEKAEKDWENLIKDTLNAARQPIDDKNKNGLDEAWESGKSFNELLDEEEVKKRDMFVGDR